MKSSVPLLLGLILSICAIAVHAQQAPPTPKPGAPTTVINLTAKSANVSEAGVPVRINILRWSTEEERLPMLAALNPALAPPPAAGARGGRGRGARADDPAPDPAQAEVDAGARGARGGRGGRGGRGADAAAPAKPPDPISNLAAAIGKAPTVGYVWTNNEVVGYSIKYAQRIPFSDGGERILLATDRKLGGYTNSWKAAGSATPTDYDFTVFEIRLDPKGAGEGKTSLTAKVVVDSEAKALVLENYSGTPATLTSVKK
jgi:hypothetical protein